MCTQHFPVDNQCRSYILEQEFLRACREACPLMHVVGQVVLACNSDPSIVSPSAQTITAEPAITPVN